ncbi:hypothetical protein JAAARDRAFT_148989 [Jaapia argillacea MUCL 33604]|uniref:Cytochrome P450 n=1 Tax=Jaapia argillacea MUCL 33604 TaxID=933084 RepID=A0A067Q5I6_9AGAM|nr:hypothetical protein JAAARDRAFT_148989 [Jaapia argillacea MUCL 33604]
MYPYTPSLLLLVPLLLVFCYALSTFLRLLISQHLSPLRRLPGPPSHSWFMGNLKDMHDQENNGLLHTWQQKYGNTFVYKGFIGGRRLMTMDLRAVAYILGSAYDYPKPEFVRDNLASMAAGHDGLLTVEGDQHRRQRKILAPAFTTTHIKSLTPIFWEKATQLRDIWLQMAQDQHADETTPKQTVDVLAWLGRATLDVIGLAGFGYPFNSLENQDDELANAFSVIFSTARKFRIITILQVWFPILRRFRRNNALMGKAKETMKRIGLGLIQERRDAVLAEMENDGKVDKTTLGRDLFSVLVRSNMSTTPSQRMSTPEILCQISTFLTAGYETTSSSLTWTLYALSLSPSTQNTLRTSLRTLSPTSPSLIQEICELEYLDWVVRESLRLHAPITNTMRAVGRERDEIPLKSEVVGKDGVRRAYVEVRKGDIISVPIQAIGRSMEVWGEDANLFRPERWKSPPEEAKAIPGLYSNILTFLNGNPINGNRACIGYRFALIEIKIFLYVLLRDLEFSIDPTTVVEKKINVVTRPFVRSEPGMGNQMPLYIRSVSGVDPTNVVPA